MSDNSLNTEKKQRGIAHLFSNEELKVLFKKFLILNGIIEICIFLGCWLYQLGLGEFNAHGTVDVPFPWKLYFLLVFLAPITITFVLGIIIAAFNKYIYGTSFQKDGLSNLDENGYKGKLNLFFNSVVRIPFLLALLFLGIGAGVIYRIDEILALLGRLGVGSMKLLLMIGGAILVVSTIFGLVWMILSYNIKKKNLEYQYKRDVMDKLGVVFNDDKVINVKGQLLTHSEEEDNIKLIVDKK